MIPFASLKGQDQARRALLSPIESNRLAHAYLFAGPDGSGRLTAALDLARTVMCRESENGFCGTCSHCRQISAFSHPDVRLTMPIMKSTAPEDIAVKLKSRAEDGITPVRFGGNTYISIEQIRELERRLSKKSYTGRGYVEIVMDAHLLRREAANAMLKTLEEPPRKTLLILITSRLSNLLPTVRSRTHTVRFGRLTADAVREVLLARGVEPDKAYHLSLVADGCPGRALELSTGELGDSGEARELFSMATAGETDVMEIAALAAARAREHGREGLMDLCSDLIRLAHDARREKEGAAVLSTSDVPPLEGMDYRMLSELIDRLNICMTRLRANVSPAMALAAALTGSSPESGKRI